MDFKKDDTSKLEDKYRRLLEIFVRPDRLEFSPVSLKKQAREKGPTGRTAQIYIARIAPNYTTTQNRPRRCTPDFRVNIC